MWTVCVDTYSLEAGDVGKYLTPIARYPHRTAKAAFRRLGSCISGKLAKEYRSARKFYALSPEGRELTWTDLRAYLGGDFL